MNNERDKMQAAENELRLAVKAWRPGWGTCRFRLQKGARVKMVTFKLPYEDSTDLAVAAIMPWVKAGWQYAIAFPLLPYHEEQGVER